MRLAAAAIVLVLLACAALSSHAHKPFDLRIDEHGAKPGTWPKNARAVLDRETYQICRPMLITVGPDEEPPITRT